MSDEQFHEFHLDGKQMVFLFMASTVVAVVIFLCGVMVGRGVRASQVEQVEFGRNLGADSGSDPEATAASSRATGFAPLDNSRTPDDVTEAPSPERLDTAMPSLDVRQEPLPERSLEADPDPTPTRKPASDADERAAGAVCPAGALRQPPGDGWAVQVMSLNRCDEADTARRSLAAKKYPTFIMRTPDGTRYRVRVGKYSSRNDALVVADRLRKVEQFTDAYVTQ